MGNNRIDEMMKHVVMDEELKEKIRKQTTQKGKVVPMRKAVLGKVAMIAMLCVAMLGTVTVAAATNKEKIEKIFVDIFNLDEDKQEELVQEGYIRDFDVTENVGEVVSATDNGITLTVKQTFADSRYMMIVLHVKSENGLELNQEFLHFDKKDLFDDNELQRGSFSIEDATPEDASPYERYLLISYSCAVEEYETLGDSMELICENLMTVPGPGKNEIVGKLEYDAEWNEIVTDEDGNIISQEELDRIEEELGEDQWISVELNEETNERYMVIERETCVAEGKWHLKWKVTGNDSIWMIPVNETLEKDGQEYFILNIEVTPLTYFVDYETKDEFDPISDEGLRMKFIMKDGSVLERNTILTGSVGKEGQWSTFHDLIKLEQLETIIVEDMEIPVEEYGMLIED